MVSAGIFNCPLGVLGNASADGGMMRYFTWDGVLSPYIYVFYVAYIVAFLFTPVMRTVASYYGIIDQPDAARKMHSSPVAYLGGMAVFMGWLAGLAIVQFLGVHRPPDPAMPKSLNINFAIVVGACIIVVLGLWDDVLRINPRAKIFGQTAAAVALLTSGVGTRASWIFVAPVQVRLHHTFPQIPMVSQDHWLVLALSSIMVISVIVACCNATNLMDGLDGLCGGVTGVISFGFLFLAVHLATMSGALRANDDGVRVVLALALLGAVLGFIPYNFNPASIFMGDTGSMFLGYSCGTMIILFAEGDFPKWFLASVVMFALPVLDTVLAFARRWVNKRHLFSADRHHLHHQLVNRGFTIKQTVIISYALAVGFAGLGALIVYVRTRYAAAIYLVVFGSIGVAAYKMGMVHEKVVKTRRRHMDDGSLTTVANVQPATVLEVRDDDTPAPQPGVPRSGQMWVDVE